MNSLTAPFLQNWDLLTVGVVIILTVVLAFLVYFSSSTSVTHQSFLGFSLATALWGTANYLSYQGLVDQGVSFDILRATLFFVTWMTFFLFLFAVSFPDEKTHMPAFLSWVLWPWTTAVSLLATSPFVLASIKQVSPAGVIISVVNGPAMPIFGMTTALFACAAIAILVVKTFRAGPGHRDRFLLITIGLAIMFASLLFSNFLLPVVFNNPSLLPLAALFVFPFIAFTSYAILKYHLLNVRVLGTEVFIVILLLINLVQLTAARNLGDVVIQLVTLFGIVVVSILVIRSVLKEVEQREKIEKLAGELQDTNERQEGLIHFIGHEVKGFLTKAEGAFAALGEGDFGTLPDELKPFVAEALKETRDGVTSVSDILKAANQKKGTVEYEKAPFDLRALVIEAVEKARPVAEGKKLGFELFTDESQSYPFTGDKVQIADHVFRNLIDNAVAYTPKGSVEVSLKKENGPSKELGASKYIFAVKDSGIGISTEDRARLFTEGGHGKESQKVNVHSTGYGLFIAKNVIEAHGGTIRAESDGSGHGSTFIVELPAQA